ncbi:MAG TPA: 1-acyl-sn-glycerol-3-phosphate acyltransferase, partial [bacterium]|nr:1-acyl-sn-glycerol-3-phosphate acyltransferase [bacterium]
REHIDKNKNYIFMPNHLSFLDGPLIVMLIPQSVRVIVKKEVYKIPVFNYAIRRAEFIPVDREGKEAGKQSIEKAVELIKQKKYSFLVFPEGTRSRTGDMQEFRRGGFFLALDSNTPILPAVIKGSHELMPKHSFFVKRGKVEVTFLPAVPMDSYTRENMFELMDTVRTAISRKLEQF